MKLRPITEADLDLYRALVTDPEVMHELGGPLPEEGLREKVAELSADAAAGRVWFDVIEVGGERAGTICIWDHDGVTEIGWMLAREHQGKGHGTRALAAILERARAEGRWREVHAYPGVTNGPSNALCRRAGFELLGELEVVYKGRPLRCNDWRLRL